jgi:hypothetical protein
LLSSSCRSRTGARPPTNRLTRIFPFLLVAVLQLPAAASAQKYWGLTGGATLSDASDDYNWNYPTSDSRWGGTAGLVFGVRTYRSTTIALEPAWIMRGGGSTPINYIEVPLTFGAAIRSNNGAMRYGLYTGISAAFKVSCGSDGPLTGVNLCDHVHSTDFTIPIGFRLLRTLSKPGTFLGVDVKYGIPVEPSFDNLDVAQRAWSFRLIYVRGIVP